MVTTGNHGSRKNYIAADTPEFSHQQRFVHGHKSQLSHYFSVPSMASGTALSRHRSPLAEEQSKDKTVEVASDCNYSIHL